MPREVSQSFPKKCNRTYLKKEIAMKLSKQNIDRLKLAPGQSELVKSSDDVPGLRIRLRDNGSRSWEFKFGKQPRMTLGKYPAVDVNAAHKMARELYAKVILGGNPVQEIAEAKARRNETFGAAVAIYLERRQSELRPRTFGDVSRHLKTNLGELSGRSIAAVDRRAIAIQLARIATTAPTQANRTLASVHAFFRWCVGEGLLENNPATGLNKAKESGARDRVLSNDEIRALWTALPASDYGDLCKLLLLTGQRREEFGGLLWSEIDMETGRINLPAERTKNGRAHVVPLSDSVAAILQARPRNPDRDLVFGERVGGFGNWSKAKAKLDARLKIQPWRLHDLRRTCATHMAELGVQPHVIEAVLNHISGSKAGVAGIYNRSTYESEKSRALELWGNHVEAIASGKASKVVPIKVVPRT
jgi:integrase